jgi:hypothetical protein
MGNSYYNTLKAFTADLHGEAAAKELLDKERRADAEMAIRFANLHMPEDLRARAKSWRLEAFFEVLWNNAFQAGYREGLRDRGNKSEGE